MPTINWYCFILSFLQIQNKRISNIAEEAVINDEDVDAENAVPDLDITKLIDPIITRINHENYNLRRKTYLPKKVMQEIDF